MSLIGAAIAGGMEGAGDAATQAMQTEQKYVDQRDLQQQYVSALQEKDMRLAEQQQGYHVTNTATDYTNTKELTGITNAAAMDRTMAEQTGAGERNKASIQGSITVANIDQTGAMARTQAEIAEQWKQAALQGTHYTPTADGSFYVSTPQADGSLKTGLLTDQDGKPIKGVKNIPENVLKAADAMIAVSKAALVQNPDNQDAKNQIATAIAMLGVAVPAGPAPTVSDADKAILFQNGVPSPQLMADLDAKYKTPGLASLLVSQHVADVAQKPQGASGGSDSKVNRPPLIKGAIPPLPAGSPLNGAVGAAAHGPARVATNLPPPDPGLKGYQNPAYRGDRNAHGTDTGNQY